MPRISSVHFGRIRYSPALGTGKWRQQFDILRLLAAPLIKWNAPCGVKGWGISSVLLEVEGGPA